MSIQKLHYENLGGLLIRREGLLNWRCPLCKAEGQSPEVMRACPECGSKEATLPGAQNVPSVPDISDDMIEAIESRAEQSYRRHFSGCRGQQATPADDISWHVIHATREVLVEAMEAKP